jgi:hypothetical protein|tara:strand:+ start:305 stop:2014 length:1710 start_codon:yes stop_codon:yes gene_type:complete
MANQRLNIDIVARDKTKQALGRVQGALSKVKGAVFNLQSAFVGLGAGLVIRNLVNTGKELENLQVRLKFLLKDTNEGAKAFENMTKFASQVPFSLEEIQSGAGILATVTDNAEDLQKMLEITGNVASVTGLDFRTTAEQIQRSFSAGIGSADLFREKGVRNMLGFKAGATVSIQATVQAFEDVFGRGGRFGKATDDLARTFGGTLSMLGDKIFTFKKNLLDAGFFTELKNQFGDLDKFLEKNADELERIAIVIGTNLAQATITGAKGIKLLTENFRELTDVLGLLLVAFGSTVKILIGTGVIINNLIERIKKFTGGTKEAVEEVQTLKDVLSGADANEGFVEPLESSLQIIHDFEHELSVGVPSATEKAIQKFRELNSGAIKNLEDNFKNIRMIIVEGIDSGISKMSQGLARAFVFGEKLSDTFKNIARTLLVNVLSALIEIVARKGVELAIEKMITKEKQKQVALSGVSGGGSLFSMAKSFLGFAKGGAVAKGQPVVVGERGAEMFIPNSTGQITQSARGTGGGQTTVNFNINTLDASGFDDLLVRNRGTITQIINNAVNERGSKNLI